MVDPQAFAARMVGLNAVPEPLWWLLGAVVAFYFGARETFYFRNRPGPGTGEAGQPEAGQSDPVQEEIDGEQADRRAARAPNAALRDWQAGDR